jgi:peptidase E
MPKEFQVFIESLSIKYFDASYEEDIDACSSGHIYITGGHYSNFLLSMANRPKLLEKIQNANIIIGESCGAMIL